MFTRIILALVYLALAAPALILGQEILGPSAASAVEWTWTTTAPWASVNTLTDTGTMLFWLGVGAAGLTALALMRQFAMLMASETQHVPRPRVAYLGVLLLVSLFLYGGLAEPFPGETFPSEAWLLEPPRNILLWFALAPLLLTLLNFLREVGQAMHEYEEGVLGGNKLEREFRQRLKEIRDTCIAIDKRVNALDGKTMTELAGLQEHVGSIDSTAGVKAAVADQRAFLQRTLDGVFGQLRRIEARLNALEPRPEHSAEPMPATPAANGVDRQPEPR